MFGNSFFKYVVVLFSMLSIILCIFSVIFKLSPIYAICLFVVTLILNVIDNVLTTREYNKNIKSIEDEMNKFKKDMKKGRKK